DLLVRTGLVSSKGDARRQIEQKAVRVDDVVIEDVSAIITLRDGLVVQKGKRHFAQISQK
ncbi:tyrosine--tRNA ligase, partial [Patescibacteria group bacterium]|nr:tyrosine--tRNA ligase [Patescibacteria group bacterium]